MNRYLKHIVLSCLSLAPVSVHADTVIVGNATELRNAIVNASAGRVILVEPGSYGAVSTIRDEYFNPRIYVRAQNVADPPVFTARTPITLFNCSGITWENLIFDSPSDGEGLKLRSSCSRMTIRSCHFKNGKCQLDLGNKTFNCLVEWNTFEKADADSLDCFDYGDGLTIRNNEFIGHEGPDPSLHEDYIQFAVTTSTTRTKNITIEDNIFTHNGSYAVQTVSFFNEQLRNVGPSAWPACAYVNIKVRRNYIVGNQLNAIALWGVIGADVSGNTLRKGAGAGGVQELIPGIHIFKGSDLVGRKGVAAWRQLSEGLEIHNNVVPQGNGSPAHEQGVIEQSGWGAFPDAQKPGTGNMSGNPISATAWPTGWVMPQAGR